MKMRRVAAVLGVAAVVVVPTTACSNGEPEAATTSTSQAQEGPSSSAAPDGAAPDGGAPTTSAPDGPVTLAEAERIALESVGSGEVTWSGPEDDRGAAWEIEVTRPDGSEVDVLVAANGEVVS